MSELYGDRPAAGRGVPGLSRPRSVHDDLVTCGAMLCEVRHWTEAEWAALPEARRPREAAHCPGRGWFAPVPIAGLN
jgi:hypothetical protein